MSTPLDTQIEAPTSEALESQITRLARFILEHVPGEPSQNEGAVDTAIRILAKHYPPAPRRGLVETTDALVRALNQCQWVNRNRPGTIFTGHCILAHGHAGPHEGWPTPGVGPGRWELLEEGA
jgi:hypothetical protein